MLPPHKKAFLPILRQPVIERPSLLARLNLALDHKLTLIAAPPGYGKTTIVTQLARQVNCDVVWHSVEDRERDLPNLVAHCLEALSVISVAVSDSRMTSAQTPEELATLVTDSLRDGLEQDILYVLDDIQYVLGSPECETWLQAFVSSLPPKVHVVLVGRALPPLPMMELVAHREVMAIGQEQLRLSFDEVQTLAEQTETALSPVEVQQIIDRLGGWAAGTILALQPFPQEISAALFGEKQPPEALFTSLAELMLQAQDKSLQDFLLASSTVSPMNPTICQVTLGLPNSRENLSQTLAQNLFVSEVRGGLAYHPTFQEFLQSRLKSSEPARFIDLHCRAARWFEERDQPETAFDHYIRAGQFNDAAYLAERVAPAYYAQGKRETVLYWCSQLAEAEVDIPQLLYLCASIHTYRYQYDLAEQELARAELLYQAQKDLKGIIKVSLARANIQNLLGEHHRAMTFTNNVLTRYKVPPNMQGYAHYILGTANVSLSKFSSALRHFETALPLYRATGDTHALALLLVSVENVYRRIGYVDKAITLLHEAIEILRSLDATADLLMPLNNLAYSQHLLGEYDRAEKMFQEGLQLAEQAPQKHDESYLLGGLADVYRDRGAFDKAISLYNQALQTLGSSLPAQRCLTLINFATLRRRQGDLDESLRLLSEAVSLAQIYHLSVEKITAQISLLVIRATRGERNDITSEIQRLSQELWELRAPIEWAHSKTLCVYVDLLSGDTHSAHKHFHALIKGVVHEANMQPGIAEIYHTPLLNAFIQMHRLGYPSLVSGVHRLEAAQVLAPMPSAKVNQENTQRTYSLRLWTLGQEAMERDGIPIPTSAWRSLAARELFFYLLFNGPSTREQLGVVLWEESSYEKLRGNFHSTLHRARNAVGTNTIFYEDGVYRIDPEVDVWCDAIEFGTLVQKARLSSPLRSYTEDTWRRCVKLYSGDLLHSLDRNWIIPHRESLQKMYIETLLGLGTCCRMRGNLHEALTWFRQAAKVDPYREEAYRAIMSCYAGLGEQALIHRELEDLTSLLETELGISPSLETTTLAQSLLA